MKKKNKKKYKYYSIISTINKYLHGAFTFNKEGLRKAQEHLKKIDPSKKNFKIIKN
jgi:hypothetical protein